MTTRMIYLLTKREAHLESGKINAAGGQASAFYDRDMTNRKGGVETGDSYMSRRHWGVLVMREPEA